MSPAIAVALIELAAEVTKAVFEGRDDSPSDFADRIIGIGLDAVPVAELRAKLDARDADIIDAAVDIAVEAKLNFVP